MWTFYHLPPYVQSSITIKTTRYKDQGTVLLKHLGITWWDATSLNLNNFWTADHVGKVLTAFNMIRATYMYNSRIEILFLLLICAEVYLVLRKALINRYPAQYSDHIFLVQNILFHCVWVSLLRVTLTVKDHFLLVPKVVLLAEFPSSSPRLVIQSFPHFRCFETVLFVCYKLLYISLLVCLYTTIDA